MTTLWTYNKVFLMIPNDKGYFCFDIRDQYNQTIYDEYHSQV